jgi:PleD family two-component response regulator
MQTLLTPPPPSPHSPGTRGSSLQTVVVVGSDLDAIKSLDCGESGGRYDRVLLSPRSQAYAQIVQWHPNLVVVSMSFDDLESYQLLTMLAMNPATRRIPIVLLVTPDHDEDAGAGDCVSQFPYIQFNSVC